MALLAPVYRGVFRRGTTALLAAESARSAKLIARILQQPDVSRVRLEAEAEFPRVVCDFRSIISASAENSPNLDGGLAMNYSLRAMPDRIDACLWGCQMLQYGEVSYRPRPAGVFYGKIGLFPDQGDVEGKRVFGGAICASRKNLPNAGTTRSISQADAPAPTTAN